MNDIGEVVLLSDQILALARQPGKIMEEMAVQLPRSRNLSFALSEEFLSYKKRIWIPAGGCLST